jgi:putative component of membrane protein insertase Oxa1/YidC/SpoIIIJ protein YidD
MQLVVSWWRHAVDLSKSTLVLFFQQTCSRFKMKYICARVCENAVLLGTFCTIFCPPQCGSPAVVGSEYIAKRIGLVVQLVRIHACHAWGRGFESRPDRQNPTQIGAKACKSKVYRLFCFLHKRSLKHIRAHCLCRLCAAEKTDSSLH